MSLSDTDSFSLQYGQTLTDTFTFLRCSLDHTGQTLDTHPKPHSSLDSTVCSPQCTVHSSQSIVRSAQSAVKYLVYKYYILSCVW